MSGSRPNRARTGQVVAGPSALACGRLAFRSFPEYTECCRFVLRPPPPLWTTCMIVRRSVAQCKHATRCGRYIWTSGTSTVHRPARPSPSRKPQLQRKTNCQPECIRFQSKHSAGSCSEMPPYRLSKAGGVHTCKAQHTQEVSNSCVVTVPEQSVNIPRTVCSAVGVTIIAH